MTFDFVFAVQIKKSCDFVFAVEIKKSCETCLRYGAVSGFCLVH